ncbi:uncharacterized protein (DUF924 family) [Sphingomonas naasensis]|uniref:DUF924 domain-containing protein n=1 Tax=Sphingomonas naasensis TaxID=1344951 RepID=A0A4S1WR99_9SPHN|nr:DUF924 family protein [Sphingomonas naasensis]NIJ20427.1 uncharacterized protein (DUF924 family) [Sphingomonas naasensis]TGX44530.1 DUF924 domain-containing protein [Sphingomonas naasensis]
MASDLGAAASEVHVKAEEVLGFWFEGLMPEQWFAGSEELDRMIGERFEALRREVLASRAAGWRDEPRTLLAAVILLDQFSRNVHRGTPEAFAADPVAQELASLAVERGWDRDMTEPQRQFLYLPFEHAENRELQAVSLSCYASLGQEEALDYARQHAEVIARYGRFPSRNAALGRTPTPEEEEYLRQPGAGW